MSDYKRYLPMAILDAILVNLAVTLAFFLRFDGSVPHYYWFLYFDWLPIFTLIPIFMFFIYGLYNRIWRFASMGEFYALFKAVFASTVLLFLLNQIFASQPFPKSVIILTSLLMLILNGGVRFSGRITNYIIFKRNQRQHTQAKETVLIVGAGGAGAMVARTLMDNETPLKVVGFVDDSPEKLHRQLYGLPVLGSRLDIPSLVADYQVKEIILALPSASREEVRQLVKISRETPARLKILPSVFKVINGQLGLDQIRSIKLEDLLGRDPVEINLPEIAGYLANKVVLITGAGGSIGSELCREIAGYCPQQLVMVGHGENSIYEIELELRGSFPQLNLAREIADIRDKERIEEIFNHYCPYVVFHAAAHKHVPLMETAPYEAFSNNVNGTINVARAAGKVSSGTFILVSTDKAVNPSSIMGATKRAAELAVLRMAGRYETKYAAVRFGNVLGSRGSVVPLFKRQIEKGGPVTVTHPDMTRYFMLIREAVQLVIQAGSMAKGGEVFILDMGEPVRIVDLSRDLIKLSGFQPDVDIEICYTGVRPGEKMAEELLTSEEGSTATHHKRIYVAKTTGGNPEKIDSLIDRGLGVEGALNQENIIRLLEELVPNFSYNRELRRYKNG